jgi:hypothetical protein
MDAPCRPALSPTTLPPPPRDDDQHVMPLMEQYVEIKAAGPRCLLFYRMGDLYELFFRGRPSGEPCVWHRVDQTQQASRLEKITGKTFVQ